MSLTLNRYDLKIGLALFFILGSSVLNLGAFPVLYYFISGMRMLFILYAMLLVMKNWEVGKFTWLVGLFYVVWGWITYRAHGAMNLWGNYCMNTIGIAIWLYYAIKRSPEATIRILCHIFSIFIYANLLALLMEWDDALEGFLLGTNYNQIGSTLLCGIITYSVAYKMGIKGLWQTLVLCGVSILTTLYVGSMTSATGCILTTCFLFIPRARLRKTIIISLVVFYVLFQAVVVFLRNDLSNAKAAAYLVEDVMKKDLTFTNRTLIWLQAYDDVMESPITGYGAQVPDWFSDRYDVKSSHNILLQIMLYGGAVLLGILILIVCISALRALQGHSPYAQYIGFGVCTFFFMMIMETYNLTLIFYTLCMLYYSPKLVEVHEQ